MLRYLLCATLVLSGHVLAGQAFIRQLEVLEDSIGIRMLHGSQAHGFPPLDMHCLCLLVPGDHEGKVLVELVGVSKNHFANFHGHVHQGLLRACFSMRGLTMEQDAMLYEEKRVRYATLRKPAEPRFR